MYRCKIKFIAAVLAFSFGINATLIAQNQNLKPSAKRTELNKTILPTPQTVPPIITDPDNFFPGIKGLPEQGIISVKNVDFTVTADVELKSDNENGVIIAQGGRFAGWAVFMKDGKPVYEHNFFGLQRYQTVSNEKIPAGEHKIVFHFTPDDPKKFGCGGTTVITVDGKQFAQGRTEKMVYGLFSSDEGVDIGLDEATPVSLDYKEGDNQFTGKIIKVNISVK